MTPRKKALLEAALICSEYADAHADKIDGSHFVALELSEMIEAQANSPRHFYPPGKPITKTDGIIDLCGNSEELRGIREAVEMYLAEQEPAHIS